MKKLIRFLVFGVLCLSGSSYIFGQSSPATCSCSNLDSLTAVSSDGIVTMSSIANGQDPSITTDGSITGGQVETEVEAHPFWQIDFGRTTCLESVSIYYDQYNQTDISDFYVIISDQPLNDYSLNAILNQPGIVTHHVNINFASGSTLPISGYGRYMRIQSAIGAKWKWREVIVWGKVENCSNGIDDDCDGFIDCDDNDCQPVIFNVAETTPTCPLCDDGILCIQAFRTKKVSIDGGQTWTTYPGGTICFDSLAEGSYEIIVEGVVVGCNDTIEVDILAPRGEHGDCFNGGFEEGTFENWTGSYGTWNGSSYDDTIGIQTGRHGIIPTSNFRDPLVPEINTLNGGFGDYIAKVGDGKVKGRRDQLEFCFDVDENNMDFCFMYAIVLQNPDHSEESDNPGFGFEITEASSGNVITSFDIESTDPFLATSSTNQFLKYRSWECFCADLSAYEGQEVCFNASARDCKLGGHFGYAYIDGLCSDVEDLQPEVDIFSDQIVCFNEKIHIGVDAKKYRSYRWTIEQIDQSGITYGQVVVDGVGMVSDLFDLKQFYEDNSEEELDCNIDIKVKLEVFNACGIAEDNIIITYLCQDENIDYCDYLIVCLPSLKPQIQGVNDCDNCTVTWSPGSYLNDRHAKFPVIQTDLYTDATNRNYVVEVVTQDGCIYRDTVRVRSFGSYDIVGTNKEVNKCSYEAEVVICFDTAVTNHDMFTGIFHDETTGANYTAGIENVYSSSDSCKRFFVEIERDTTTELTFTIDVDWTQAWSGVEVCVDPSDLCSRTVAFEPEPESVFWLPWVGFFPNVFSPWSTPGVNDTWHPFFASPIYNTCSDPPGFPNPECTSIYWYEVKIFDRWGELVFEGSVPELTDPYASCGYDGSEVQWNGMFNDQPMTVGTVLTYWVKIKSCFVGSNSCSCTQDPTHDCGGVAEEQIHSGSITIIL